MTDREKMPAHEKGKIISMALDSGFMLSTMYGQDTDKLMPASDTDTLLKFAEAITKAKVEAIRGLITPTYHYLENESIAHKIAGTTAVPKAIEIRNKALQDAIDILEGR